MILFKISGTSEVIYNSNIYRKHLRVARRKLELLVLDQQTLDGNKTNKWWAILSKQILKSLQTLFTMQCKHARWKLRQPLLNWIPQSIFPIEFMATKTILLAYVMVLSIHNVFWYIQSCFFFRNLLFWLCCFFICLNKKEHIRRYKARCFYKVCFAIWQSM